MVTKYYKDFFWHRNLEYETLQNIDHAKRYLDSKGIQNWHFNFERPVGPFQITSVLPNNFPKWFEVDVHTLTMIDDYEQFKYNKAKIVLKDKFLGKKTFKGFLKGVDKNGKILLETENHKIKFNFFEIEKANIDPNWALKNN